MSAHSSVCKQAKGKDFRQCGRCALTQGKDTGEEHDLRIIAESFMVLHDSTAWDRLVASWNDKLQAVGYGETPLEGSGPLASGPYRGQTVVKSISFGQLVWSVVKKFRALSVGCTPTHAPPSSCS